MRPLSLRWIAAPLLASTAVASASPGLGIEVGPAPLVLSPGGRESAEVRIHVRDESGRPAACALRLGASVGALSEAREVAPGEYAATWRAPTERYPQVALLAASGPGGAFATQALPLHARVAIEGRAEPRGTMRILVDDRLFGPAPVGRRGQFRMWVEVPPGGRAVGVSTDRLGNERRRDIDLGLPPFPRRLLAVAPERLTADGVARAEVLLAAIDERGRPEAGGAEPCRALRVDAGTLGAPVVRGPGICSVTLTAPRSVGRGLIVVRAPGASARVALEPGLPRLSFLDASTGGARPGRGVSAMMEGERRALRLQARDDLGNRVPGLRLEATVEREPAPAVADLGGGLYEVSVRAPVGRDRTRVEVRAPDRPEIDAARLELPLVPPAPVALRLVVEPARARRGAAVTVRVLAPRGRPPSGAVWLESSGRVDPGPGSNAPEPEPSSATDAAAPAAPVAAVARRPDLTARAARRCWISSGPPPRAGNGDVELFACRVTPPATTTGTTSDEGGDAGRLLLAAVDSVSGATVYRWIPVE